eukprot:400220-Rhodomonas_salina.1
MPRGVAQRASERKTDIYGERKGGKVTRSPLVTEHNQQRQDPPLGAQVRGTTLPYRPTPLLCVLRY